MSKAVWTRSLKQNDVTILWPGCWVLLKMAATMFEFWASFETNFIRKACTLKAETLLSALFGVASLTNPSKQIQTNWHVPFTISSYFPFVRLEKISKIMIRKLMTFILNRKRGVALETVHNKLFQNRFAQNTHEWFI